MPGILTKVDTLTEAIEIELDRKFYHASVGALVLLKPDSTQGGFTELALIPTHWTMEEGADERGDGQTVRFPVADLRGEYEAHMRALHSVRYGAEVIKVSRVDFPLEGRAVVYIIHATRRQQKKTFFDNR